MSVIEANIVISVPDSVNISSIVSDIQSVVSNINGKRTHINVVQIGDTIPLGSISPTE